MAAVVVVMMMMTTTTTIYSNTLTLCVTAASQAMMLDLERSAHACVGGGSSDVSSLLVTRMFMKWMEAQPQVVGARHAGGKER